MDQQERDVAGLCFKPGLTPQERAEIFAALPPGLPCGLPLAAMGGKYAREASELVLASRDFLALFGAKSLGGFAWPDESGTAPGGFAEQFVCDAPASTGKLRLRFGQMTRIITFFGRRIAAGKWAPFFAGAVMDVADEDSPAHDFVGDKTKPSNLARADKRNGTRAALRKALQSQARGGEAGGGSPESELRRLKGEFRELNAILDTAADGVAMLDWHGLVRTLNRLGEALFGCDEHEVRGKPLMSLLAPESRALAHDYLEGLKSREAASLFNQGREVAALTCQGGTLPVFMTLTRIAAPGTRGQAVTRFCALFRDLTQWKKAEQELEAARKEAERANALKSAFVAKVSHEIRTPLNAILGFAEVMMGERFGPIGNQRYKDYLGDIHASGTFVMSLVDDLLDLSKIEAGKMEFCFASADANRIVADCASMIEPQAGREQVEIRLSLSPALPNILADERALRQIILNLLSNAVKFNRPGGQVIASTLLVDSGCVIVRIRDNGFGMREADIDRAFEPFQRLSTERPSRGTGLGLPLTKALVEANGASMTIKSKEQEGTLAEVVFPPARILAE